MTVSPYANVFFYFRGPSTKGGEDPTISRQVEDNTTKALINVLQLSEPAVARSWLEALSIEPPSDGNKSFEFFLQGGPDDCHASMRRMVVITAGDDAASATWSQSSVDKGRIDAAIHVPDQLLVAVEAKVGASLDGGQLAKHAEDWKISVPTELGPEDLPSDWIFTTWSATHQWASALAEQSELSDVAQFLLSQFAEYLEIIGVTSFAGFRPEDFDLLNARRHELGSEPSLRAPLPQADPVQASLVKDRVRLLWEEILPRLSAAERAALGDVHIGSLRARDDRMWAATNWGDGGVNFTLELDPEQLELDLVAWNGGQVTLFERWLQRDGSMEALARLSGWELVVWRRRAMESKAGTPFWMHNTYEALERIPLPPPPDLSDRLAGHRASCEDGWELTAYHVRRAWRRDDVTSSAGRIAEEIVSALRPAIPLLHTINWHKRVPLTAVEALEGQASLTLVDMGFALTADSDPAPGEWQFVASGPDIMVTSPSGMHLRGIRYFLAIWPGPGEGATYVACDITKGYAGGGREALMSRHYYGPDVREAIRAINDEARSWQASEHYPADLQPLGDRLLDEDAVIASLRAGWGAFAWGWESLDSLARRGYDGADVPWAAEGESVELGYRPYLEA